VATSLLHEPGDLARVPLAAVLIGALNEQATGVVVVDHDGGASRIFLSEGVPVGAQCFTGFQPLGQMLLARGRIDVAALNESLAGMAATGRRQGEVLVEIGAVSPQEVDALLTEQQEGYLVRIASLEAGTFRFERGKPVPAWTSGIRIQPLRAIVRALERAQGAALVASALQPAAGGPVSLARGYQKLASAFGWTAPEQRLIDRLATLTTLEEFFADPGVSPERARAILAALLLLGLAQARPTAGQTVESVPGLVVDLADLAGVEVGLVQTPPPGRPTPPPGAPQPTPPPAPLRRSDPEESRRRRQRLLQRAMQNMGVGPLAGRPPLSTPVPSAPAPAVAQGTGAHPLATPAETELRRAFEAAAPRARVADLFARLGIEPGATRDQVKQAYFALAKQFHPDRFLAPALAHLGPAVKDLFAALNEAYEVLSDDKRRAEFQARAAAPGTRVAAGPSTASQAAAALDFQKGEACLRTRDHARARGFLEAAVRAHPRAEYQATLAQALAQDPRAPDRGRARELLAAALQDPTCERAAWVGAQLARDEGRDEEAERLLRRTLQVNPRNVEAERELRLLELRRRRR